MNFVSPFQPEREFKVYKSCKCSLKFYAVEYINTVVDFKSHYIKTKISEMDISNIFLKNESFEIFA